MKLPTDGSFCFGARGVYYPNKLISEGGFGSVWTINQPGLVCKFGLSEGALGNEVKILTQIHERIQQLPGLQRYIRVPQIVEAGVCHFEGKPMEFFVMERFGPDLSKLRDLAFTTELNRVYAVLRAGVQILKGLYSMHVYMNLVHGDVKPSNFLFKTKELSAATTHDLVFIDLGLARPVRTKNTSSSGINGTRSYASIHVQKKYLPTPRCDLESLGYMLLHFIDHSLPWNREIRKRFRKNKTSSSNDDAAPEEDGLAEKIAKEKIALAQKRLLKKRVLENRCETEGENILAEYFYAVFHMHIVPDTKTYKLLSGILYNTLKSLQDIALQANRS